MPAAPGYRSFTSRDNRRTDLIMSHALMTFLGRTERDVGGYPKAHYRFPDDSEHVAAFVGFPLAEWLEVDRLIILGTAGSMWDELLEADLSLAGYDDERLALVDAVDQECVEQPLLDQLAPALGASLGRAVQLRLIPAALAEEEQVTLLSVVADATQGVEALSIDVTHGYRHLPMLALTAALYLRGLRPGLQLRGLWYAAYAPNTGRAQLSNLAGLLQINEWIDAWQRLDWLGDYGAISPLMEPHDEELADGLRRAAFLENTHQGQHARTLLRATRQRLEQRPLTGAGALYQPELEVRTRWVESQRLYQRQRDHARAALERDDFLRSSLYGFEAFITKLAQREAPAGQENDRHIRKGAKDRFEAERPSHQWRSYRLLRDLRNVLAHGNKADTSDVQKALHSPERLRVEIRTALDALLPTEEP